MCKEIFMVEDRRFELLTEACKATAFPITPIPRPPHTLLWWVLSDSNREGLRQMIYSHPPIPLRD